MNEDKLIELLRGISEKSDSFDGFFKYLEESEQQALALIAYIKNPHTPPTVPTYGSIEAGFVLYWIHYPPAEVQKWINENAIIKYVFEALQLAAPPTKISIADYDLVLNKVDSTAVPWDDGTLIGKKKYEQLDHGWLLAAINYAINLAFPDSIHHPLPKASTVTQPLTSKTGGDPVIGIIGDWGTGYFTEDNVVCPAQRVATDLANHKLDYLFHLGDVYYAGTDLRPMPGEEQTNFLNIWPDQGSDRNYTLNSNHEMYGAAQGYFDEALKSSYFSAQAGASYFARTYGQWLILGLDSAYYSDAKNGDKFYMDGAIGTDSHTGQIDWLKNFRNHSGPIFVLTHHNPCDTITARTNDLFNQVHSALGKFPDVWYWGHVHNGIIYNQLHLGNTYIYIPTIGRCCGHGSIPFGNGWGLEKNSNIAYYANTKDPLYPPNNPRVLNGYTTVQLHQDASFTEKFYEVGNPNSVWNKTWTVGS